MGMALSHILVVIKASDEHTQFSGIAGNIHVQDSLYFLFSKV